MKICYNLKSSEKSFLFLQVTIKYDVYDEIYDSPRFEWCNLFIYKGQVAVKSVRNLKITHINHTQVNTSYCYGFLVWLCLFLFSPKHFSVIRLMVFGRHEWRQQSLRQYFFCLSTYIKPEFIQFPLSIIHKWK